MTWSAGGGQRTSCRSLFSPSAMWVLGVEPRLSSLAKEPLCTGPSCQSPISVLLCSSGWPSFTIFLPLVPHAGVTADYHSAWLSSFLIGVCMCVSGGGGTIIDLFQPNVLNYKVKIFRHTLWPGCKG